MQIDHGLIQIIWGEEREGIGKIRRKKACNARREARMEIVNERALFRTGRGEERRDTPIGMSRGRRKEGISIDMGRKGGGQFNDDGDVVAPQIADSVVDGHRGDKIWIISKSKIQNRIGRGSAEGMNTKGMDCVHTVV